MLRTWRNALLLPGRKTFEYEKANPNATWSTALLWMVIAAVIPAVLLWVNGMDYYYRTAETWLEFKVTHSAWFELTEIAIGAGGIMLFIIIPVIFLFFTGLRHILAKILKGQGSFGTYAYLCAAIEAPVIIISGFLCLIPGIGFYMSFLLMVYMYTQRSYATKVAYNLSSDKAIAVVMISPMLGFVLVVSIIFGLASVIMNFLQG